MLHQVLPHRVVHTVVVAQQLAGGRTEEGYGGDKRIGQVHRHESCPLVGSVY